MLILEIAIGIVLGAILLTFLPAILELGTIFVALIVVVAFIAFIANTLFSNQLILPFIATFAVIVFILLFDSFVKKLFATKKQIKDLEKQISERKKSGYEPLPEQEELLKELKTKKENERKNRGIFKRINLLRKKQAEQEKRKNLGYDN